MPAANPLFRARWLLLAGVALVLSVATGVLATRRLQVEDDVLVIAHRGPSASAPENTLAAVERAIEERTDFVEIDVQETKDGEIIVIHDSDFMKVAGAGLKVWDATFEQVRALDVGRSFAPEFEGERVPLLEEVLAASRGKAKVLIELKYYGHDQRLEERVVEIVERTGMAEDVMVISFSPAGVSKIRTLRPDWKAGLLSAASISDLSRVDVDFLAVSLSMADAAFIRRAHRAGKEVYLWTVNDAFTMSLVMSRGVDGVITDHPGLARTVLEERAKLGTAERLLLGTALWFGVRPRATDP